MSNQLIAFFKHVFAIRKNILASSLINATACFALYLVHQYDIGHNCMRAYYLRTVSRQLVANMVNSRNKNLIIYLGMRVRNMFNETNEPALTYIS